MPNAATSPMPMVQGERSFMASSSQISHAANVPQVPLAGRTSPLPKPKAMMRENFLRIQLQRGYA